MNTYTWISAAEPKATRFRTLKDFRAAFGHVLGVYPIKIKLRFETGIVPVFDNAIEGFGNVALKTLILSDGSLFRAIGSSDPYAAMNTVGVKRGSDRFTDAGRAWSGALIEDHSKNTEAA